MRPKFKFAASFSVSLLLGSPMVFAQAEIRHGSNFLLLDGATGLDGCLPGDLAAKTVRDRVLAANETAQLDPQLGVVFSLEVPPCADLFYAAVANDVRGIGYQHSYEEELFDDSPHAALEGVAFLNDVPYWEFYPEELGRAFLHEVGHRWGVRVHVSGSDPTALLGRDHEHWSYFLETSGEVGVSPLEGNVWRGQSPEYSSATHSANSGYSALDLYLMGLLAPEDVAPFELLIPEEGAELPTDCRGATAHPGSPPQRCESVDILANPTMYTISDVIEVEGARDPEASAEPTEKTIAFYFFTSAGAWTEVECLHWQSEVERLVALFSQATEERMSLSNLVATDVDCAELVAELNAVHIEEPPPSTGSSSGCALVSHGRSSPFTRTLLGLGLVLLVRRRHNVRAGHSSGDGFPHPNHGNAERTVGAPAPTTMT